MRQFLQWYLGLPDSSPGEGSSWSLQTRSLTGGSSWVVVVSMAVGVVLLYRRQILHLSWRSQAGLISLRLAAFALLGMVLSESALQVTRTGLPYLAVMIDTSASMGLVDQFDGPTSAISGNSRLQSIKDSLLEGEGRSLAQLGLRHRLRFYQFDESSRPLETGEQDRGSSAGSLAALVPDGNGSRPGPALRDVLNDFRGAPPAAVVVFTDGVASTTEADRLSSAVDLARSQGVPVFTVAVGSDRPVRDLQAYDLVAEDLILLGDPAFLTFRVSAHGPVSEPIQAELFIDGEPTPVARTETQLTSDAPATLELSFVPPEEGEYEFTVRVASLPQEQNSQNNELRKRIRVRREKIRVLLVERMPRWEFRHLKPVLERDEAIDLRTLLQESDTAYIQEDRTALPRFPSSLKELAAYDVVILGDIDVRYLPPQALEHLREFVKERGGGLVLIAGETFNPRSFAGTELEPLVPVHLSGAQTVLPTPVDRPFRLERTPAGRGSPVLRLTDDSLKEEELWRALPEQNWHLSFDEVRSGAQVLATNSAKSSDERHPVLLLQRYGAGQVMLHATDELWQWRRIQDADFYSRYWTQLIRAMSRAKLVGASRSLELTTDRSLYGRGDPVRVRAQIMDPARVPPSGGPFPVSIEGGGISTRLDLVPRSDVPSRFEGTWTATAVGQYQIVTVGGDDALSSATCEFHVEVPNQELRQTAANRTDLIKTSRESHGRAYELDEVSQLIRELPPGNPVVLAQPTTLSLWNRWEPLVLLLAILGCEWYWRQRLGLS